MPEIPKKEEDRPKINRSYDIFVDQNDWLVNSSLNKSKKIRELLDNFINEIDSTIIYNLQTEIIALDLEKKGLREEIVRLKEVIRLDKEVYFEALEFLKKKNESQKSVIVALGGKE